MVDNLKVILQKKVRALQLSDTTPTPKELQDSLSKEIGQFVAFGDVMRNLQLVMEDNDDLKGFIGEIFKTVRDPRDHNFRYGSCDCESCR